MEGGGWVPNPAVVSALAERYGIPEEWATRVDRAAWLVGGHPDHLAKVIWHESRFNTKAQYGYPKGPPGGKFIPGRAVGLIQFTGDAAKSLGTTQKALFAMPFERQMDYVERYLVLAMDGKIGNAKGPLDTQYRMALAVFYPGWRNLPPESPLPEKVAANNPGITTIGEYVNRVLASSPPTPQQVALADAGGEDGSSGTGDGPGAALVIGGVGLAVLAALWWSSQD